MATAIRLKRMGAKKEASYRIIVTDSREGSSGASIERLGTYNPRTQPSLVRIDAIRTLHWLNEGAQPSDTVRSLLKKTGLWQQFHDGVDPASIEEAVIEMGPPPGQRGTSQRPAPTDREPKQYDEPEPEPAPEPKAEAEEAPEAEAAEDAPEAEAAEDAPEAEAAEEAPEAEAAEDAPEAEADEAVEAEADDAPEAEADAPEAEAGDAPEAEAEESAADEAPEEATAEAEEAAADEDAEAEAEEEES